VQKLIEGIWLEISSNSQITPYFLSTAWPITSVFPYFTSSLTFFSKLSTKVNTTLDV
jgi:hypothetical protein